MKREMDAFDYAVAVAWGIALAVLVVWLVDRFAPYLPLRW